jgi:hypothetical protein
LGKLKYAPQFNIDKDIAAAFVIARRGLGYKEKLPKNYKGLLNDKDFLLFSEASIEDNIAKLKKRDKRREKSVQKKQIKKQAK